MKWNEAIAIGIAVLMGLIFIIYPLGSLVLTATGVIEAEPKFSAFEDGYSDISEFVKDVERFNRHVRGSIFYTGGGENDGVYDYKVRSIVSTPTILLGDLIDPKDTIYLAIGIEREYTQEEIRALNSFLQGGVMPSLLTISGMQTRSPRNMV
jgi:hypothetical protein